MHPRGADTRTTQNDANGPVIIIVDPEVVQMFIRQVYLFGIIFILGTMLQWLVVSAANFDLGEVLPVPPFVWLLAALILMTILNCFPQTRYTFPCNWILVLAIVILCTIAGTYFMFHVKYTAFLVLLLITASVIVALHIYGACCPRSVLPGDICTGCLLLILLITLLVMGIIMMVIRSVEIAFWFTVVLLVMIIVCVPYQAQFMHGRLGFIPLGDMLGCALSLYLDFCMIFVCLLHIFLYKIKMDPE